MTRPPVELPGRCVPRVVAAALVLVASIVVACGALLATTTTATTVEARPESSTSTNGPSALVSRVRTQVHVTLATATTSYDDRSQLASTSARPGAGRSAPRTAAGAGTDLVRAADFADDAAAFGHYSKHVKGIELRPNGGYRLKPGGADLPEFGSFAEYRNAARSFLSPDAPPGVLQGYRGTDLVRLDPKTGYFGVRAQNGNIRTFFRPDGDPVAYFWSQFG